MLVEAVARVAYCHRARGGHLRWGRGAKKRPELYYIVSEKAARLYFARTITKTSPAPTKGTTGHQSNSSIGPSEKMTQMCRRKMTGGGPLHFYN